MYLLAKIYIKIGRKTGIKKYFYTALSLLNLYAGVAKKLNWDYYYTKAYLFEVWGFYERAMNFYKFALYNAKNQKQEIKTLIGIIRTAVWLKKLDTVSAFAIRISIQQLLKQNTDEVQFLNGLILFEKGKYKEASKYLLKTYKYYETYLIDNPQFYYIVAENMYRIGKYKFAKQLFRKIIGTTQDLEIIRKAILRLGDIDVKQKDLISAFNHYYYLAQDYNNTKEAIIAKLKILSLKDKEPIKEKLAKIEDEDLKNPIKFVYQTLISNRNTPLGRYALGNFGQLILKYNSDFLIKKLSWELSVLETDRLSYEEKEYIRDLWKEKLINIEPKYLCELFKSNPRFFEVVFDENTLLKLAKKLGKCNLDYRIHLYRFLAQKYKKDIYKLKLAESLFNKQKYKEALKVLKTIKKKNCQFYTVLSKVYIFSGKSLANLKKRLIRCKNPESQIVVSYIQIDKNLDDSINIAKENIKFLAKNYEEDIFIEKFIEKLITKTFEKNKYQQVLNILKTLSEKYKEDCNINSWYIIAMIRANKEKLPDINVIKNCSNNWSKVANEIYQDYQLTRGMK